MRQKLFASVLGFAVVGLASAAIASTPTPTTQAIPSGAPTVIGSSSPSPSPMAKLPNRR